MGGATPLAFPMLKHRPERGPGEEQRCSRRECTPEAAPEAVRQAVGGGWQIVWGQLLSVPNALKLVLAVRETWLGVG